eukprot:SAG11_NODE_1373_length_5095_cov_3.854484_2_plen_215_part_00
MNLAGVDAGVLQSDHVYGELDEYFGHTMGRFPDRFFGLAQCWEPEAGCAWSLAHVEHSVTVCGNCGLYFSVEPFSLLEIDRSLNDPRIEPLWQLIEKLAVPIFWFLDDRTCNAIEMYNRRVAELDEWCRRHPTIKSVITHGLVPAAIIAEVGIPSAVFGLLKDHDNLFAELLFPAKERAFPYPEGQRTLRQLRDHVGAHKLLWGSDSPYGWTAW